MSATLSTVKRKNKQRAKLKDNERCKGIKTNGERCSRKHTEDSEYCKTHIKKEEEEVVKVAKKRGRKPNTIADPKIYEPETYIPVIYTIINGKKLLIDFNNRVYTNDLENPVYLGVKTVNGIVK
jgi:hypothetical protein